LNAPLEFLEDKHSVFWVPSSNFLEDCIAVTLVLSLNILEDMGADLRVPDPITSEESEALY
jgi:hypothetical protein